MIKSFLAKVRKKTSALVIEKGLLFKFNHQNGPTTINHFLMNGDYVLVEGRRNDEMLGL